MLKTVEDYVLQQTRDICNDQLVKFVHSIGLLRETWLVGLRVGTKSEKCRWVPQTL